MRKTQKLLLTIFLLGIFHAGFSQSNTDEQFAVFYSVSPDSKAVLYNPISLTTETAAIDNTLVTEESAKSNLVSVYARKKVSEVSESAYSLKLMEGYAGYNYTIIGFAQEKAVARGIVKNDEVLLDKLVPGTYSIVLHNEDETCVQVVEKK